MKTASNMGASASVNDERPLPCYLAKTHGPAVQRRQPVFSHNVVNGSLKDGVEPINMMESGEIEHDGQQVGDDQDRDAAALVQVPQEVDNRSFTGNIHSCGWLIEDEHIGIGRQRSGQQDTLLLPRRKVAKQALGQRIDAEQPQR